jgi:predicted transcriptional regulator
MADRFTITKTKRWGNADTQISNIYSANRREIRRDDVIKMANDLMTKEEVYTNEVVEYEVILSHDNGMSEFIHRVEKGGKKSN